MAQPSVSSFFITRKRGLEEDIIVNKKKVICLEQKFSDSEEICKDANEAGNKVVYPSSSSVSSEKSEKIAAFAAVRQNITPQRARSKRLQMQNVEGIQTPKLANFYLGGNLSPQKKPKQPPQQVVEKVIEKTREPAISEKSEECMKTPTKKSLSANSEKTNVIEKTLLVPNNVDELKKKLRGSSRLTELKTSLNKLRNGFDKLDQMEKKRMAIYPPSSTVSAKKVDSNENEGKALKVFKNIELEILSPKKAFSSPMKLKDSPMKNTLIGSPKHLTPKRLFSPTKSSPVKAPAYERFQALAEAGTPSLQLPFKYRYLLEIFKAVDTVCAMFFNRKEKITFKKLKPAVQRILRKNFFETHLAQIQKLMPNAYKFAQEKTRNFGSTSKQDYYQLVITPNIKNGEVNQLTLSPQILIERTKEMTAKLTDLVFYEHDKFLQGLDVPMNVTRGALKRWHPDFPLENVPDIEHGNLPMPPNVEKFSCAKDILSTARNLFNCSTPMERALERLDVKKKEEKAKQLQNKDQIDAIVKATPSKGLDVANDERKKQALPETSSALLKGVPQSLLEKIRAKQAAKALDTMTRRPSQERDAIKYARLPEVARHIRNVFVTEKKGVLPLDIVLTKIQNSYKACVTLKEIEELMQLISKEMPRWLSFHDIRNMMFVKVNRETDLTNVIEQLQDLASKKAQI